jgi:hypothetical protein
MFIVMGRTQHQIPSLRQAPDVSCNPTEKPELNKIYDNLQKYIYQQQDKHHLWD